MFRVNILTLFPEVFPGSLGISICKRSFEAKLWDLYLTDIKNFSYKDRNVDSSPYGGGPGMVMRADVLQDAYDNSLRRIPDEEISQTEKIMLSPKGKRLDQKMARKLSKSKGMIVICGRYEGVDERFLIHNEIEEVSVGDFVLSGGEIGAQLIMDATIRLIPEVIGNAAGLVDESFERHLLEYPLYTHPRVWKDMEVPEVLLSGNHKKIQMWKLKMSEKLTKFRRPDLWSKYIKS